jgi:hypothetical protein
MARVIIVPGQHTKPKSTASAPPKPVKPPLPPARHKPTLQGE